MIRGRRWLVAAGFGVLVAVVFAYLGASDWGGRDPYAIDRQGALTGTGNRLPNVIVILLDTTRADHLGVYGYAPESTPFLSRLADESVVFERAFSVSSWTAPATASVFTGQYPWTHGIVEGFEWHRRQMVHALQADQPVIEMNSLRREVRTMPEHFRGLGYATIGLASNINIGDEIGFDRGFDRFVRDRADPGSGIAGTLSVALEPLVDVGCVRWGLCGLRRYRGTAGDFRARLRDWEDEIRAAAPYFLYVHFNDPHEPYLRRHPHFRPPTVTEADPQAPNREDQRANYLSEISYVDAQIEQIFHMAFRDDNTLFVVLSDHGEEFGDHGNSGHSTGLHAELNRVVMMMHGPGLGIRAGRIADINVSQIDVLPTLLDVVGAPVPFEVEGRSLAPLLRAGADTAPLRDELSRRVLFAHRRGGGEWFAAIDGPWKLIRSNRGQPQLFDLASDPLERVDLRLEQTAIANRLESQLRRFDDESIWRHGGVSDIRAGKALEEQLEALGYVR